MKALVKPFPHVIVFPLAYQLMLFQSLFLTADRMEKVLGVLVNWELNVSKKYDVVVKKVVKAISLERESSEGRQQELLLCFAAPRWEAESSPQQRMPRWRERGHCHLILQLHWPLDSFSTNQIHFFLRAFEWLFFLPDTHLSVLDMAHTSFLSRYPLSREVTPGLPIENNPSHHSLIPLILLSLSS